MKDSLQFDVLRCALYHSARHHHFARYHRWVMFGIVALGTAGISNSFEKYVGQAILSAATAMLATADLVLDLRAKAELHGKLKASYFELLAKLEELSDNGEVKVTGLIAEKIRLTATEPSEFRAVDAMAHNEAVDALGREPGAKVLLPLRMRLFAHFLPFRGYTFKYVDSKFEESK